MCFYDDDCPSISVYSRKIVIGRKSYRCESCRRAIEAGEQQLSVFYVVDGNPGSFRVCNQCVQDSVSIYRHEMRAGCRAENAWAPWEEVRGLMLRGNPEEQYHELDTDDANGWNEPVLFWPYGVPPAVQTIDLKAIPEMA